MSLCGIFCELPSLISYDPLSLICMWFTIFTSNTMVCSTLLTFKHNYDQLVNYSVDGVTVDVMSSYQNFPLLFSCLLLIRGLWKCWVQIKGMYTRWQNRGYYNKRDGSYPWNQLVSGCRTNSWLCYMWVLLPRHWPLHGFFKRIWSTTLCRFYYDIQHFAISTKPSHDFWLCSRYSTCVP